METNSRRKFIKGIAAIGAMAAAPSGFATVAVKAKPGTATGYNVLFQGDSITDGNRSRNNDWNHVMGHGFAYLIASRLWFDLPKRGLHFFNRGVSGNKVTDLAARWQTDTIDLKPNLLNILVGINDANAFIDGDENFTAAKFEENYRQLLGHTKEQLPNVQLVLCDPFILPVGKIKDQWNRYYPEVQKRQQIVAKLAAGFNAIHIEFQKSFDKALSIAPAEYWIWDGIHPMPAGHELMAREWIKQVKKKPGII